MQGLVKDLIELSKLYKGNYTLFYEMNIVFSVVLIVNEITPKHGNWNSKAYKIVSISVSDFHMLITDNLSDIVVNG